MFDFEKIPYAGKEPPPPARSLSPATIAKREAEAHANSTIERLDAVLVDVPPRRARIIIKLLDERLCKRIQRAVLEALAPGQPEKEAPDEAV